MVYGISEHLMCDLKALLIFAVHEVCKSSTSVVNLMVSFKTLISLLAFTDIHKHV